jgi:hypothetical protein
VDNLAEYSGFFLEELRKETTAYFKNTAVSGSKARTLNCRQKYAL